MLLVAALLAAAATATAAGAQSESGPSYHIGCFDWDDNLLVMPATVYMQRRASVGAPWKDANISSAEYAQARLSPDFDKLWRGNPFYNMFADFCDQNGDDVFPKQVARSLRGFPGEPRTAGAAMPILRYHLAAGLPITVITARLHAPDNIRTGFGVLLQQNLTAAERARFLSSWRKVAASVFHYDMRGGWWRSYFDDDANALRLYLSASSYYPVSWPVWHQRYARCASDDCKATAIRMIVDERVREVNQTYYPGVPAVSFSDDDEGNLQKVIAVLRDDVAPSYPGVCFRVYNTTDLHAPAKVIRITHNCAFVDDSSDVMPAVHPRLWWDADAHSAVAHMPTSVMRDARRTAAAAAAANADAVPTTPALKLLPAASDAQQQRVHIAAL